MATGTVGLNLGYKRFILNASQPSAGSPTTKMFPLALGAGEGFQVWRLRWASSILTPQDTGGRWDRWYSLATASGVVYLSSMDYVWSWRQAGMTGADNDTGPYLQTLVGEWVPPYRTILKGPNIYFINSSSGDNADTVGVSLEGRVVQLTTADSIRLIDQRWGAHS